MPPAFVLFYFMVVRVSFTKFKGLTSIRDNVRMTIFCPAGNAMRTSLNPLYLGAVFAIAQPAWIQPLNMTETADPDLLVNELMGNNDDN